MERTVLRIIIPFMGFIFLQNCGSHNDSVKENLSSFNEKRIRLGLEIIDSTWSSHILFGGKVIEYTNPNKKKLLDQGKPFYGMKTIYFENKGSSILREEDDYYTGKMGFFVDGNDSLPEPEHFTLINEFNKDYSITSFSVIPIAFSYSCSINEDSIILISQSLKQGRYINCCK